MAPSRDTPDLCVAVIACNAERTIERTLASVQGVARRIIVVDSGSSDRTPELCRRHGAEVIERPWPGHVRQKQFALEQCDAAWVLSLDSDESLDERGAAAVRRALCAGDVRVAGYRLNRRTRLGDFELRHAWQPEWRTRLVRRDRARWTGRDPHDRLVVDGPVRKLAGTIRHDSFADVRDLARKAVDHGLRSGESAFRLNRRGSALRLAVSPPLAVFKQLVLRSAWRDGWPGWVAACYTGLYSAVKHMRLLELSRRGRP